MSVYAGSESERSRKNLEVVKVGLGREKRWIVCIYAKDDTFGGLHPTKVTSEVSGAKAHHVCSNCYIFRGHFGGRNLGFLHGIGTS